jgi:hypothetical protein
MYGPIAASSPKSKMRTTLGWRMWAAAWASIAKRWRLFGESWLGKSRLSATSSSSAGRRAA